MRTSIRRTTESFIGNLNNGKRLYLTSENQLRFFKLTLFLFPAIFISVIYFFTIGTKPEFSSVVLFTAAGSISILTSLLACKKMHTASLKGEVLILNNCFSRKSCVTSVNSVRSFRELNLLFMNLTIITYYLDGRQRKTIIIGRKKEYLSIGQLINEAQRWSKEKKKANHKPGSVVA